MLSFLALTLAISTPLILAAMAGYASERSGVVNIALEGIMLGAAVTFAAASPAFGPWGALAASMGVGILLSLLHWLATQVYRLDHVISGMAVNALASGLSGFAFDRMREAGRTTEIPTLPTPLFQGLAILTPLVIALYVARTRGGLRLVAVGSDPDKARLMGVAPLKVRLAALTVCGILCAFGGAMLVSDVRGFTDNMTDGRGYIALAALVLGGWRPLPSALAALGFGFLWSLRLRYQGAPLAGVQIPSEAWAALPYLATVLALAGFLGRSRTPAGLGKS
ncbi:ABC transporter permease [bacterium]|nr:MAG: ABC transporter permease [bacterium]